jgi:hypothetical protein
MSSITESFLISDLLNSKYIEKNNPDDPNKKWYDRIYVCVEKSSKPNNNNNNRINGFDCKMFPSLETAEIYSKKQPDKQMNAKGLDITNVRMSIFPMCKWMPCIFDKLYLRYKLKKIYWSDDITLYRRIIKNDINR